MKHRLAVLAAVGPICAALACRRSSGESAVTAPVVVAEQVADAAAGVAPVAPARCRPTDLGVLLDDGGGASDLEIGDAVPYPGGYAVGVVRSTAAGRTAAVALLGPELTAAAADGNSPPTLQRGRSVRIIDLGPTLGDAPPPRIGWRPPELVAAAYGRLHDGGDTTREMVVYAIADGVGTASSIVVPQQRDDSLAFDLAFAGSSGLLAWDEATSAAHGVVRAVAFSKDHAASARDISPPDSDAELPRVVAIGSGFVAIWDCTQA
jgi:hypothetical protein